MDVPSMVQRSGDTLIVRSVVSGNQIYIDQEGNNNTRAQHSSAASVLLPTSIQQLERLQSLGLSIEGRNTDNHRHPNDEIEMQVEPKDEGLPQCKIKRNYSCSTCTFFTQNPRFFLTHLRDIHGEKIVINECKLCLYASRHYQKLVRHMKMVHGSTEGIEDPTRKRQSNRNGESRKRKVDSPVVVPSNLSMIHSTITPPYQFYQMPPPSTSPDVDILPPEDLVGAGKNRLLKCSVCDFTTLYKEALVKHEGEQHCKTKFFRCEKCSYVTHIKARFSKHVKYHSMPMIKCVTCDFRTPYKWNLDRHMKNHGGTGPFKCAACNFTADIKQSLTVHEMNHHVPPVGHAAGGGYCVKTSSRKSEPIAEIEFGEPFHNNNIVGEYGKKSKLQNENDEPTDLSQKPKKAPRPIPNLIPILPPTAPSSLTNSNLIDSIRNANGDPNRLREIAASIWGGDENNLEQNNIIVPQLSPTSSNTSYNSGGGQNGGSSIAGSSNSASSKKKNSFFEKMKIGFSDEKASKNENLICICGHQSKCLSEMFIHKKTCNHQDDENDEDQSSSPINLSVHSGSTRCQFCRHRCKSSGDLANHMKTCSGQNDSFDSMSESNERNDDDGIEEIEDGSKHPMENRVFVWNNTSGMKQSSSESPNSKSGKIVDLKNDENSYYGVETAPGYGEVTKKMTAEEEAANSSLKKVYKCPHCSFWASTASRFHVHIVGHLNKKPFECSLCNYRSNWRWDITKHIRLKTIRDPSHKNAKVLMNDETGRRNYTKYNKYITLMKVTEEDGDPKLMKSGEMTPNQEAQLEFINNASGGSGMKSEGESPPRQTASAVPSEEGHCYVNGKHSPPELIKSTSNEDVGADDTRTPKTYRCKECNYMNPNRDMLVAHVKQHASATFHQQMNFSNHSQQPLQIAVNPTQTYGNYMNDFLAAMFLQQQAAAAANNNNNNPSIIKSEKDLMQQVQNFAAQFGSVGLPINFSLAAAVASATTANNNLLAINKQSNLVGDGAGAIAVGGGQQILNFNQNLSEMDEASSTRGLQILNLPKPAVIAETPSSNSGTISSTTNSFSTNHSNNLVNSNNNMVMGSSTTTTTTSSSTTCTSSSASIPPTTINNLTGSILLLPGSGTSNSTTNNTLSTSNHDHLLNNNNNNLSIFNINNNNNNKNINSKTGGNHNSGNINNDQWRGPAPYRCGHCHQASNWKHVIQRHCRLKHNGDIKIETVDRSSDRLAPIYRPLGATTHQRHSNQHYQQLLQQQQQQQHQQPKTSVLNNAIQAELELKMPLKKRSSNEKTPLLPKSDGNNKSKQQQCPTCPYVSESKSQMNYHISLHKANQYECQHCGFMCSKKQELVIHLKAFHDDIGPETIQNSNSLYQNHKQVARMNKKSSDLNSDLNQDFDSDDEGNLVVDLRATSPQDEAEDLRSLSKDSKDNLNVYNEILTKMGNKSALEVKESSITSNDNHAFKNNLRKLFGHDDVTSSNEELKSHNERNKNFIEYESNYRDMKTTIKIAESSPLLKKQLQNAVDNIENNNNNNDYDNDDVNCDDDDDDLPFEKCQKCPYETKSQELYKKHLLKHTSLSKLKPGHFNCDHCDYSTTLLNDYSKHLKLHFSLIQNNKNSVAFYTSLNNLELSVVNENNSNERKILYSSSNNINIIDDDAINDNIELNNNNQEDKILIDIRTGEAINKKNNKNVDIDVESSLNTKKEII